MLNRRHFMIAIALVPLADPARAADWPARPVRIIYPYAPGGSGDAMARILASRLSDVFDRPFVVENKPGANGTLAAETVARSPADGYTLLFALTPQIAIAPAMIKVQYDPVRDFGAPQRLEMRTFGVDPLRSTPAEFAAMVSSDIALWGRAVKLAGLEPQ